MWIALCAALAFGWVWYQYFYKSGKIAYPYLLAALRFVALMGIFLLLLPLKLEKVTTTVEKHHLLVLMDNSVSVGREPARDQLLEARDILASDPALQDRLDVATYIFGKSLRRSDSLDFSDNGTDITSALETLSRVHLEGNSSLVLVTDGVENQGRSLVASGSMPFPVYPVVVGDTTSYRDVRIDRINLNRFAFLNNQFPVEVLISYRGEVPVRAELNISDNLKPVYREVVSLQAGRSTARVTALLEASSVGFHTITASIRPLENERNTSNNRKTGGIEVIDETTEISIVSNVSHPDLGALKRLIEVNQQRKARILKPGDAGAAAPDTDLWVLYQPDASFRNVYGLIENSRTPLLTITGPLTDWDFLNQVQESFRLEGEGPPEDLLGELNQAFAYFDASGWDVSGYPPLRGSLGDYYILSQNEWLLGQRVRGVSLDQPLFALIMGADRREAVIFGDGLWKWRMNTYARTGEFQNFDAILGKLWLFLTAGEDTDRLNLEYQTVYNGQEAAVIRARFFDEALRFDPQANLTLQVSDSTGTELASYPIPLGKGYYQADIGNLAPGTYSFRVSVDGTEYSKSGQFRLQSFDLENQRLSSDPEGLAYLAEASGGLLYHPSDLGQLRDSLLSSDQYRPLQRSRRNVVSLIDYRWLLILIAGALGTEWFIRKYFGLL